MGFVGDIIGGIFGGDDAADASRDAANVAAAAQGEALDYLKEVDEVPRRFREASIRSLADFYGLGSGGYKGYQPEFASQDQLIAGAKASPLYSSIMGTQQAGEEAIMRNAAATGGLRGGNTQGALTDYGSQLANQALLQSYNQQVAMNERDVNAKILGEDRYLAGLSGLAGTPSNATQIAGLTSGIGQTQAAGITGAAQAQQNALGTGINTILGGIGLFI